MTIASYFETIREHIVIVSFIVDFRIIKQVDRSNNGYLRARVRFTDGSTLEFSEFAVLGSDGTIQVVTYSYHWLAESGNLLCRWDNTPHFPKLENAPHHIHLKEEQVIPGKTTNIFEILGLIGEKIGK